jgi:hypothetical protein
MPASTFPRGRLLFVARTVLVVGIAAIIVFVPMVVTLRGVMFCLS